MKKQLALGTANLGGRAYGITQTKVPTVDEARLILEVARDLGIAHFDTAPSYGSEHLLSAFGRDMKILTKIPGTVDPIASIDRSCQLLKREPYAVVFHYSPACTQESIERVRTAFPGLQVGVSVYTEDLKSEELRLDNCQLDIIECQVNIFDQRLLQDGYLNKWKNRKISIWARGIYMQGLVFSLPASISPNLQEIKSRINYFYDNYKGWSLANLAMEYVVNHTPVDVVIVGANSTIELISSIRDFSISVDAYKPFACKSGLDPRRW